MKTRRNKQNEFESLEKLKEIRDITNTTLRSILNGMKQKEELKKYLIQVNQFAFETEILEQKGELIPKELEDKWKNKMMELKIRIPNDIKEQEAIGEFFRKIDGILEFSQKKITKLENIKKYLLNKMFV